MCHWGIKVRRIIAKSKQAKLALASQPRTERRTQVDIGASVDQRTQTQSQPEGTGTAVSCRLLSPGGEEREHLVWGLRNSLTCLVLVIDMESLCIQSWCDQTALCSLWVGSH